MSERYSLRLVGVNGSPLIKAVIHFLNEFKKEERRVIVRYVVMFGIDKYAKKYICQYYSLSDNEFRSEMNSYGFNDNLKSKFENLINKCDGRNFSENKIPSEIKIFFTKNDGQHGIIDNFLFKLDKTWISGRGVTFWFVKWLIEVVNQGYMFSMWQRTCQNMDVDLILFMMDTLRNNPNKDAIVGQDTNNVLKAGEDIYPKKQESQRPIQSPVSQAVSNPVVLPVEPDDDASFLAELDDEFDDPFNIMSKHLIGVS